MEHDTLDLTLLYANAPQRNLQNDGEKIGWV